MKTEILGITFGAIQNLLFLPLLVIGIFLLIWRFYKRKKNIKKLVSSSQSTFLLKHFSSLRQAIKILLSSIGLLFLFLALLQPQWDKKEETVLQEGRDLFIAIDVSRSMLAEDSKPNRLAFAKKKIKELVNKLKSERVGLIIFSGSTFVQCPLTSDYSAFFMFLDQLDVETISSGTTAIDQAIRKALEVFASMPSKKNKLLVVCTDGEDFSSNLASIRKEAANQGMTIFTVGVGTPEGSPIPLLNAEGIKVGHIKDTKGNVVISRLNEGILHSLAQETGGIYIKLKEDATDIDQLISTVKKFEKEKFEDRKFSSLQEQYPYFLLVSFICFAIEWLL